MKAFQKSKTPKKYIILERVATGVCTFSPYDPEIDLTTDEHGEHINIFVSYADSSATCQAIIRNRKGPVFGLPKFPIDDRDFTRDRSMDFNATQKLPVLSSSVKTAKYDHDPMTAIEQVLAERARNNMERMKKRMIASKTGWYCKVHGMYLAKEATCIVCKPC